MTVTLPFNEFTRGHKKRSDRSFQRYFPEIDVNNDIQIAFSGVIHRNDQDLEEEIKEINRKLENLYKGKGIKFINNTNIHGSCLNRSKLHLNKSGTALLVKIFSQALKPN